MDGSSAGLILAAFKRSIQTKRRLSLRLQARIELAKIALERGYNEEQTSEILGLLEWIMQLSEQMEKEFQQMLEQMKRERGIRVLPSFMERELRKQFEEGYEEGSTEGHAKGRLEALQMVLLRSLETLYGGLPTTLAERIQQIEQDGILLDLQVEALRSGSLEVFLQKLDALTGVPEPAQPTDAPE